MKKTACFAGALAVLGFAPAASARTVSLWPIEDSAHGGLRSAIDARHNFANSGQAASTYFDQTVGWNLPPNPDETGAYLFEPVNRKAQSRETVQLVNNSTNLTEYVLPTRNFTLEGWLYLTKLPVGSGDWTAIAYGAGSSACTATGWLLELLSTDDSDTWHLYMWRGAAGGKTDAVELTASQLKDKWIHLAITYAADNGAGKNEFKVYVDGVLALTDTFAKRTTDHVVQGGLGLSIGRTNRPINGQVDYWRLSDETLSPDEFLNAGGSGTIVPDDPVVPPSTKTVAYWTLDAKDGRIDANDHVGTAHLSDWYGNAIVNWPMTVHDDMAFTGATAPNGTTVLKQENAGSFLNQNAQTYLAATNLLAEGGFLLDLDRAFTVEGWFKPVRRTAAAPETQYLFSTRNNSDAICGWSLFLKQGRLNLLVQDGTGTAANLVSHVFNTDLAAWGETWKHVALVYNPIAEGVGEWQCWLDGALVGCVGNGKMPGEGGVSSRTLFIGGNPNTQSGFFGALDCVRVAGAALTPKQFLDCTDDDAAAATNVLALWPLDGSKGFMMDGHDEIGGGAANGLYARNTYLRTESCEPSAEKPDSIANPDTSLNFNGDPSALNGSTAFTHSGRKYLASKDSTIASTVGDAGTWTLEGYLQRTGNVTGTFGIFFATYNTATPNTNPMFYLGLAKSSNNFMLGGVELPDSVPVLNTWYHFAIITENIPSKKTTICTLYLDGVCKGVVTNAKASLTVGNSASFSIGGINNTPRGFPGNLCHLRLSKGALAQEEFLCASAPTPEPPAPVAKASVAYWPLDKGQGEADMETRLAPSGYGLYVTTGVTGADVRARASVPNKDVPFDRRNDGSVALGTDGSAANGFLGQKLGLAGTWTVEGWIKGEVDEPGRRTLCGTYTADHTGWKLWLEPSAANGTPTFGLCVRPGLTYTPFLDKAIALSAEASWNAADWNHVALVHNPATPQTEWTIYVNGKFCGAVGNDWRNGYLSCGTGDFALGTLEEDGQSFVGTYDMWRVSSGALEADDLLYRAKTGLMMLFR